MDILPLSLVSEDDVSLVGVDLRNLSVLAKDDFPIPAGIIVFPPEIKLKTLLEYFDLKDKEIFEQRLTIIKKEIQKIEIPRELQVALEKRKLSPKKLWLHLLEVWIGEIRSKIWREGFAHGLSLDLSAQSVLFTQPIIASGSCYIDVSQNFILKMEQGLISDYDKEDLHALVLRANKKLFLPQVYFFVQEKHKKEKSLKITRVKQYTPPIGGEVSLTAHSTAHPQKEIKLATKIFLKLESIQTTTEKVDGFVVNPEDFESDEKLLLSVSDTLSSNPDFPLIYKLKDQRESFGGIRGSIRLLHQKSLLVSQINIIKFLKNKRGFKNIAVGIPFVRSIDELREIKKELSIQGLSRSSSLKLWMEVAVPENITNLDRYIEEGIDGVIIKVDELLGWLGGYDIYIPESSHYMDNASTYIDQKQVTTLVNFLEKGLKLLHGSKIPILIVGKASLNDELLKEFIEKGIFGIVARNNLDLNLRGFIQNIEHRLVQKKLG